MSKTPIEMMLDGVEWTPIGPIEIENPPEGLPYATHEGILHIGDLDIKVFRLNTGQAVIEGASTWRFFAEMGLLDL